MVLFVYLKFIYEWKASGSEGGGFEPIGQERYAPHFKNVLVNCPNKIWLRNRIVSPQNTLVFIALFTDSSQQSGCGCRIVGIPGVRIRTFFLTLHITKNMSMLILL